MKQITSNTPYCNNSVELCKCSLKVQINFNERVSLEKGKFRGNAGYQAEDERILRDGTEAAESREDHDDDGGCDQDVRSRPEVVHLQLMDVFLEIPVAADPHADGAHGQCRHLLTSNEFASNESIQLSIRLQLSKS